MQVNWVEFVCMEMTPKCKFQLVEFIDLCANDTKMQVKLLELVEVWLTLKCKWTEFSSWTCKLQLNESWVNESQGLKLVV